MLKSAQEYRQQHRDGGRHAARAAETEDDHLPRDPEPQRRAGRHLSLLRAAAHLQDQRAHPQTHAGHPGRQRCAGPARDRRRLARRARLDPAPRDPRRLVPAGARLPDEELRRRGGQHPHPRGQRDRAEGPGGSASTSRSRRRAAVLASNEQQRAGGRRRVWPAASSSRGSSTRSSGSSIRSASPAEADTGAVDAAQAMVDYAKQTLDRAERERARLLSQLEVATTALQAAIDKLSSAVKEHYDRVAEIDRLRVHVKENILYYMQAIWRQEPPDQRFFRLYNIDVPIVMPDPTTVAYTAGAVEPDRWNATLAATFNGTRDRCRCHCRCPMSTLDQEEARRGRRPRQRARLQGQLHGLRPQGEQLHHAAHDAGLPRRRRRARAARPRRARQLQRRRAAGAGRRACIAPNPSVRGHIETTSSSCSSTG